MVAALDADREALLDRVAALASSLVAAGEAPGIDDFVHRYYADVALDDLAARKIEDLAGAARSHWHLAGVREPGTALVRLSNPAGEADGWSANNTIVEIVTDDMPFIVDSVTMALDRHGLGVHLVVHPILTVRRDAAGWLLGLAPTAAAEAERESFLHVEVDRERDPEIIEALRIDLERVLSDVRAATGDWHEMVGALREVVGLLRAEPPSVDPAELAESLAFLEWLADNHFTFLGFRQYDLVEAEGVEHLLAVPGTGLGILRERPDRKSADSFARLPADVRHRAREKTVLVLTKANARSTVHRPGYLDYIGVKRFDERGEVTGEWRFLGLFTSAAYNASVTVMPLLREKVAAVIRRAGFPPDSHSGKDLVEVLETYPRDELLQIPEDELLATALEIGRLHERRRLRLFARVDSYRRFVSCLVFIPRDRYTTTLRLRIADILRDAFGAASLEWQARVTESPLARLHFVLHTPRGAPTDVDVPVLEGRIAEAARWWTDRLRDTLVAAYGDVDGPRLWRRYADSLPVAYRETVDVAQALVDIAQLEALQERGEGSLAARLDPEPGDALELVLYGIGAPPALSDVLPSLQRLGVSVVDEFPYDLAGPGPPRWIKRFGLRAAHTAGPALGPVLRSFEDALLAVLQGEAEDDGFNRLVLGAGLSWREVAVLRAFSRYLRQVGTVYSQAYIEDTLDRHPSTARHLVEWFATRLDPRDGEPAVDARREDELLAEIDAVESLDEDRILRSLFHLIRSTVRTNWFQTGTDGLPRPCLALKFDPDRVPDLPRPKPMFEIFVYSPRVEGVHLRAGRVARGGIRWSDRREDYRTEILGLMKAQQVKNAVIVPAGAKGGFVVKQPPADRESLALEVEACYREFVAGLLDLTDNLVDGTVVPPPDTVRRDGDDPYLVVAADKGTATFSDLANEVAAQRDFWLGDAFASGGSTGYDHKKMGITARGAWESVKRHFRQLGLDAQTTDFTVVGIGDMSGDVFGNGMLCSRHVRLVAAFDHRHVFLDPDPDPESSFAERQRLFALPRSSWADYDPALISPGGGVHSRTSKSIPLTPQVRARLDLDHRIEALDPDDLIKAILRAPVDLLFNGGIGTYVKAHDESHAEAGDKANDGVRVDGRELRCRVVAEGGNLGLTQRGRVEFALAGGLVNTDAIDNSAGVDTSDHEVNIKILLDAEVRRGTIDRGTRDGLLATMADEVGQLVLRDNYRQNRALANAWTQAAEMEDVHARYIRALEHEGRLDRALERLPDDEALAERRAAKVGLTRPELAVLFAHAKISLQAELLATAVPDDPDFAPELEQYFPTPLRDRFRAGIHQHPLRREIVATALVNGMVNRAGTSFAFRLAEETGAAVADIVRAHEVARAVLEIGLLWHDIEALDNLVASETQTEMYLESRKLVERASRWFLRNRRRPLPVATTIRFFRERVARVAGVLPDLLSGNERQWLRDCTDDLSARGVPPELARRVAGLESVYTALDITDLAEASSQDVEHVAAVYCTVGDRLHLDWLRDRVVDLPREDRWQSLSRLALREDAYGEHRSVTAAVLAATDPGFDAGTAFELWAQGNRAGVERVRQMLEDIRAHGVYDLATLSVALREIRSLIPGTAS